MQMDVQSRGFSLTPTLLAAVDDGIKGFSERFPKLTTSLQVRLFDVSGPPGGADKGCLVHARIGRGGRVVVASELDSDLHRAIAAAFEKLERGAQTALSRAHAVRGSATEPAVSE